MLQSTSNRNVLSSQFFDYYNFHVPLCFKQPPTCYILNLRHYRRTTAVYKFSTLTYFISLRALHSNERQTGTKTKTVSLVGGGAVPLAGRMYEDSGEGEVAHVSQMLQSWTAWSMEHVLTLFVALVLV